MQLRKNLEESNLANYIALLWFDKRSRFLAVYDANLLFRFLYAKPISPSRYTYIRTPYKDLPYKNYIARDLLRSS